MPCNIVKLVDVEEMNYFAAKGEGEVSSTLNPRNGPMPGVLRLKLYPLFKNKYNLYPKKP